MNDQWNQAKAQYEQTPLPEELSFTVTSVIRKSARVRRRRQRITRGFATAAACCASFFVLVNASPSFAKAMDSVPLLGNIARVFTITNYTIDDRNHLIDVRLPALENTGHTDLEQRVNAEIEGRIHLVLQQAEERARATREAYLATGGLEEDFIPIIISVDYEIKCQNDQYLSFILTTTEAQATAFKQFFTYSIDLKAGKEITLGDILGPNYKEIANGTIKAEIALRSEDPNNHYWSANDDFAEGFTSIRDDQPFYLNAAGHPVVLFEKYEIAPGFMGPQEFEILPTQ